MSKIYRENLTLPDWQYDLVEEDWGVSVVLRNRADYHNAYYVLTFTAKGTIRCHRYLDSGVAASVGLTLDRNNRPIVE